MTTPPERPAPTPASSGADPPRPSPRVLALIGYLLYGPVFVGFVLHTSPASAGWRLLGKYAPAYAAFLAALVLPLVLIPFLARALSRPTRLEGRDGPSIVIGGWRKVGFAAAAVVGGLLLAVVLARGVIAASDSSAGDKERPDDADVTFRDWPSREEPHNAWGMIGPRLRTARPAGTYRVFALGGSTTFLNLFVDPEETFTSRLQVSLRRARPAWRVDVLNAACPAHSSLHSLVKYAVLIRAFRPDAVIVMHAVNDWSDCVDLDLQPWVQPCERDYSHDQRYLLRLAAVGGLHWPPGHPYSRLSRTDRRIRSALDRTFYSDVRRPGRLSAGERRALAHEAVLRAMAPFRRNLRTLGRLVQADGARFIVASQPSMYRPGAPPDAEFAYHFRDDQWSPIWGGRPDLYKETCAFAARRYNDAARGLAADLGATFVDFEAAVPPHWDCFQPDLRDGIHMNKHGCALAAEALHEAVLPLIPDPPPEGDGDR